MAEVFWMTTAKQLSSEDDEKQWFQRKVLDNFIVNDLSDTCRVIYFIVIQMQTSFNLPVSLAIEAVSELLSSAFFDFLKGNRRADDIIYQNK